MNLSQYLLIGLLHVAILPYLLHLIFWAEFRDWKDYKELKNLHSDLPDIGHAILVLLFWPIHDALYLFGLFAYLSPK